MDGIIIINKHKGCTSHDIVYNVKKIFNEKVGHTGTLDPMATGVLPLLVGKGTLCSKYLINHDKIYKVKLQLGIKTDTADSEGNVVEEKEVQKEFLEKDKLSSIIKGFIGKQEQIPPMYSAIKVNGKKLYEYARKGQTVEIKPRAIEIYDIQLLQLDIDNNTIEFKVSCSKGTYIRSLCEDIACKLNTVGFMKELERLEVGEFNIEDAILLQDLIDNKEDVDYLKKHLISLEKIFENCSEIKLSEKQIVKLLNGVKLNNNNDDGIYRIYDQSNVFIGLGIIKDNNLKRDIIV